MSMSEGYAKTGLEQSPVTDSRKACGPHKSTATTQRKFRPIRYIRGKNKNRKHSGACNAITSPVSASAPVPGGHYSE